jgi:hypothetical protein
MGAMSTLGDVVTIVNFIEKHLIELPHKAPQSLGGALSGLPEDISFTTASLDEKSVVEAGQPAARVSKESTRPGPIRNFWTALFSCIAKRK